MTAIRFAASIVLGLVATTSAFAAEPAPVAGGALPLNVTLAAGPAAAAYRVSPNARYCFRTERTGSHIATKVCKTRGDWEAVGVDLNAALAGR